MENSSGWTELLSDASNHQIKVDRLLIAVIQETDFENVINGLTRLGVSITYFISKGGFLKRKNITLLIGYRLEKENVVVRELEKNCRKRVEVITNPLDLGSAAAPTMMPIEIGGATAFSFEVEHFEMF